MCRSRVVRTGGRGISSSEDRHSWSTRSSILNSGWELDQELGVAGQGMDRGRVRPGEGRHRLAAWPARDGGKLRSALRLVSSGRARA
jgi:hypothetical protein